MKTIQFITFLFIGSLASFSQSSYQEKMGEAMQYYATCNSVDTYQKAALRFELVTNGAPEEWLPLYYYSQCYIMMAFSETSSSIALKDGYLSIATAGLDKLLKSHPNESEVHVLQGLHHIASLTVDPSNRGQKYSGLSRASIEKALSLEPNNPRAKQMSLSNKVGTASFFGQDLSPFCAEAQTQLAEWDNYISKGPFYPTWGKAQLEEILKNCAPSGDIATPISDENGVNLTVVIKGIKIHKGAIMAELIDEYGTQISASMVAVTNETCELEFNNIKPGTYAIQFYQDVNNNQKMDTNKYGKPLESYGFSNNARGFMGAPKFKKMKFDLKADKTIDLTVK